jgi:hypothetical protein
MAQHDEHLQTESIVTEPEMRAAVEMARPSSAAGELQTAHPLDYAVHGEPAGS